MLGLYSKIYQGVILILIITLGYFYISNLRLENTNTILEANNSSLTQAIKLQEDSISHLKKTNTLSVELVAKLSERNNIVNIKLSESLSEINKLRVMESKRAIENPFEAGNAATDMLSKRLFSITHTESRSPD